MSRTARLKRGTSREIISLVQRICLASALVVFATGMGFGDLTLALVGVLLLFVANVIFATMDLRDRLLFMFLHMGIALFLLSRPAVALFDSTRGWMLSTPEATAFALWALFLSMISLYVGVEIYDLLRAYNEHRRAERSKLGIASFAQGPMALRQVVGWAALSKERKLDYIRWVALVLFLVCFVGAVATGFIKLSYMQGKNYEEYYTIVSSDYVPWALDLLNVMFPYMLCAYLATLPKRTPSTICLIMYVATTLPMLMIGSRADFVMACLFSLLYYVLRNITDKQEKWIGKKELAFAAIAAPMGIFVMGMWDYLRSDSVSEANGFVSQILDALYKQGVSFTVLGHGFDVNTQIQQLGFKFFSMGLFISNITQGFIGQTFLGCEALPGTNSAELALWGNEYAHTMSYYAHWNYLGGEGYGSSYLLELFADFGYGGIIVGSLLLGVALVALSRSIGKHWFWGTVALISSIMIVHMPRGNTMEWISFIWTTRFALAMALLVGGSALLSWCSSRRALKIVRKGLQERMRGTREDPNLPEVLPEVDRTSDLVIVRAPAAIPLCENGKNGQLRVLASTRCEVLKG